VGGKGRGLALAPDLPAPEPQPPPYRPFSASTLFIRHIHAFDWAPLSALAHDHRCISGARAPAPRRSRGRGGRVHGRPPPVPRDYSAPLTPPPSSPASTFHGHTVWPLSRLRPDLGGFFSNTADGKPDPTAISAGGWHARGISAVGCADRARLSARTWESGRSTACV
jgi:hypothetical protein